MTHCFPVYGKGKCRHKNRERVCFSRQCYCAAQIKNKRCFVSGDFSLNFYAAEIAKNNIYVHIVIYYMYMCTICIIIYFTQMKLQFIRCFVSKDFSVNFYTAEMTRNNIFVVIYCMYICIYSNLFYPDDIKDIRCFVSEDFFVNFYAAEMTKVHTYVYIYMYNHLLYVYISIVIYFTQMTLKIFGVLFLMIFP